MTSPKPNRKCIFCDQPKKLTKEHLWSKWIRQLVSHDMLKYEYAAHIFKVKGIDRSVRTYGGDARNRAIRYVCRECNNVWMSSLDDAAKPVLSMLIKGEKAFLNADSQKLIATWIAMKAMVGEFFDPAKAAVPLSERQFLRDRWQPPDNWKIWIGNYTRMKWLGQYVHTTSSIDSVEGIARRDPDVPNTQTTTIVVGKLYAHVFSSEIPAVIGGHGLNEFRQKKIAQIWPTRESFIAWPPIAMNDTDADAVARAIVLSLQSSFMPMAGMDS